MTLPRDISHREEERMLAEWIPHRITCAFDWPSFDASLESVPMASPTMRTLVATFSIVLSYYEQQYMLTHITEVTVRRRS